MSIVNRVGIRRRPAGSTMLTLASMPKAAVSVKPAGRKAFKSTRSEPD
jgi:hypothetical protein